MQLWIPLFHCHRHPRTTPSNLSLVICYFSILMSNSKLVLALNFYLFAVLDAWRMLHNSDQNYRDHLGLVFLVLFVSVFGDNLIRCREFVSSNDESREMMNTRTHQTEHHIIIIIQLFRCWWCCVCHSNWVHGMRNDFRYSSFFSKFIAFPTRSTNL